MTIKFQVGQQEPWNADEAINWAAKLYLERDNAVDNAHDRLNTDRHKGKGFLQRIRAEEWSDKLTFPQVDDRMEIRIANSELGQYVVTKSLASGFKVFVRKVEVDPLAKTSGCKDIDILYDFIFEECRDLGTINFGICNRRNIDGTSLPTQHCPWEDLNDNQGPGSRAIDVGTQPMNEKTGNELHRRVRENKDTKGHCGKILFNNSVWTPESGRHFAPVGHTGHLHLEALHAAPSQWSLVRSSCP